VIGHNPDVVEQLNFAENSHLTVLMLPMASCYKLADAIDGGLSRGPFSPSLFAGYVDPPPGGSGSVPTCQGP
jgi:hypothetical protein